ncbi:hypothetical protein [Gloeothece verrucosa]|uniref:Uncharacterized protein n=1 Tax=Gloeothece verrucosa (strain PCC 7822) TaxID=497965 RepID=E0UKP4_GLOV7|nr:hypothetical protein [Gloeothece verrucosa]ADN17524.1 hypothetical protein Cyan7822_5659 [Gloeothece verrucosa PCC 7822]
MLKQFHRVALMVSGIALFSPSLLINTVSAQTPSLGDGVMCVAKGKTKDGKIYLYTSLIDSSTIDRKQPVSVTIVEPVSTISDSELVVLDKKTNSLLIGDAVSATPPEMQPVGLALTTYQGNNTFSGKTQAGTPVSFSLQNSYRTIQIQHGDQKFTGVCH